MLPELPAVPLNIFLADYLSVLCPGCLSLHSAVISSKLARVFTMTFVEDSLSIPQTSQTV